MFCCKGARDARKAIIASSLGQVVTVVAMLVGIALYAYYEHFPLAAADAERVAGSKDNVFPIFIIQRMPMGFTGLIIAGVFAAAISSLDSVLAALSQTVISGFYKPWRERTNHGGTEAQRRPSEDRHYVRASRLFVIVWGIVLCAMAQVVELALARYGDILNLALAMASFTGGAMLAAFLLAFFRLNVDYRGIVWGAPLSVLAVFGITWHQPWAQAATAIVAGGILLAWLILGQRNSADGAWRWVGRTCAVFAGGGLAVFLCCYEYTSETALQHITVAWPWNVPIGFAVAFSLGYLLARPSGAVRETTEPPGPPGG
jgi:Na+/proline symporter